MRQLIGQTIRKIEATIGAMFAFFIGFALLCALILTLMNARTGADFAATFAIYTVPMILEALFLLWLKDDLEHAQYPFAPWFALRQRRWPLLLRPFRCAWWLTHFAAAVGGAILVEKLTLAKATGNAYVAGLLAAFAVSFTVAYAANLFLSLALASLFPDPVLVQFAWKNRFYVNAAIALVAALLPNF